MNKNVLVIPTNRPDNLIDCISKWSENLLLRDVHDVLVVFDGPSSKLNELGQRLHDEAAAYPNAMRPSFKISTWDHMHEFEQTHGHVIFSRQDSACRSFGFAEAYKRGGYDLFITIDDDVFPSAGQEMGIAHSHLAAMKFSTFRSSAEFPVRGLPYNMRAGQQSSNLNIGLWSGVADLSAVQQLENGEFTNEVIADSVKQWQVPPKVQVPMCGMNLAFRPEMIPAMLFAPMGSVIPKAAKPLGRFDDIWCGLIAKRASDAAEAVWSVGKPVFEHCRASDPFKNLIKESRGLREHESLWLFINSIKLKPSEFDCSCSTFCRVASAVAQVANALNDYQPVELPKEYFQFWSERLLVWLSLFPCTNQSSRT